MTDESMPFKTALWTILVPACIALAGWIAWERYAVKEMLGGQHEQILVIDKASLLNQEQINGIASYHSAILDAYDIDFRVVTTTGIEDINLHSVKRFEELQVGTFSKTGRGLLLVVDPENDLVRMEIGRSLEGVYTDAFVAYIEQRQMVPFFQANRVADGILATTELLAGRANEAIQGEEFDPVTVAGFEKSSGAGAKSRAGIATGYQRPEGSGQTDSSANGGPLLVVQAYHRVMESGNARSDLSIFTRATQQMMKDWIVTPAQMRNMVNTYRKCSKTEVRIQGNYGVVRYELSKRQCSPYFLQRENGAWKLDLTMMSDAIRFNHKNQWHFAMNVDHPYGFAFSDWRFDQHGFPRLR